MPGREFWSRLAGTLLTLSLILPAGSTLAAQETMPPGQLPPEDRMEPVRPAPPPEQAQPLPDPPPAEDRPEDGMEDRHETHDDEEIPPPTL